MKKDPEIIEKLHTVIDPELQIPITEMGLIYGAERKGGKVTIIMTLTTVGCPLYDVIHDNIVNTLKKDKKIKNVHVKLTFDPPWTPEMMSESAKMDIGFL